MTGDDIAQYACAIAGDVSDSMFDEHVERLGMMTEGDRKVWTHGFVAGFTSGFTTAVMRANQVVEDAIDLKSKITQPGEN